MNNPVISVRLGLAIDAHQINEIYNWYVENTICTLSEKTSLDERKKWLEQFNSRASTRLYVAQIDGSVVGYAFSLRYRNGGIFKSTIETSLYVHPKYCGVGVGSQLYSALLAGLADSEFHRVVVEIALPNDSACALHAKFGFEHIGIFDECIHYKGKYQSILCMQKKLYIPENA
ncbi:MAG: N-acetyltransferase [Bdellovibrionaceae bacterium]|nr:N-acetyltransferase [Pseudobdellovibrionaceae bacterium]